MTVGAEYLPAPDASILDFAFNEPAIAGAAPVRRELSRRVLTPLTAGRRRCENKRAVERQVAALLAVAMPAGRWMGRCRAYAMGVCMSCRLAFDISMPLLPASLGLAAADGICLQLARPPPSRDAPNAASNTAPPAAADFEAHRGGWILHRQGRPEPAIFVEASRITPPAECHYGRRSPFDAASPPEQRQAR